PLAPRSLTPAPLSSALLRSTPLCVTQPQVKWQRDMAHHQNRRKQGPHMARLKHYREYVVLKLVVHTSSVVEYRNNIEPTQNNQIHLAYYHPIHKGFLNKTLPC